jgi:hypothetical protein
MTATTLPSRTRSHGCRRSGRFCPAAPSASGKTIVHYWAGSGSSPATASGRTAAARRGQSRACHSLRAEPQRERHRGGACFDGRLSGLAMMRAQSGRASTSRSSVIAGFWHSRATWRAGRSLTSSWRTGRQSQQSTALAPARPKARVLATASSSSPGRSAASAGRPDAGRVHASAYSAWILQGRALFDALAARDIEVIEVFPTASWTRWHCKPGPRTRAARTRQGLAALGQRYRPSGRPLVTRVPGRPRVGVPGRAGLADGSPFNWH